MHYMHYIHYMHGHRDEITLVSGYNEITLYICAIHHAENSLQICL